MNKVLMVYGGDSVEHEISIITALQAYLNYKSDKYELELVYLSKDKHFYVGDALRDIKNYKDIPKLLENCIKIDFFKDKNGAYYKRFLKRVNFDYVWLVVHGLNCEDGTLYNYFKVKNIMCIGMDHYQACICQDKYLTKQLLKSYKINQIPYVVINDVEYFDDKENVINKIKNIGYPVIVKPSRLGSSIGVKVSYNEDDLLESISNAMLYDRVIIVEKYLENIREFNVSILGNRKQYSVSLVEEICKHSFLSYDDKYKSTNNTKGMAGLNRIIPANIEQSLSDKIKQTALKVANILNVSLVTRLDFIYDETNKKLFFNEINNIPGSLAYYLWEPINISFSKLIDSIISIGIQDEYLRAGLLNHYKENVLNEKNYDGIKLQK